MKTYRTPRDLEVSIERALQRRANLQNATPLDEVAGILGEGRHYSWIGIYLVAEQIPAPAPTSGKTKTAPRSSARTRAVIPIGLGQRVYGAIEVQSEQGKQLSGSDRVLLKGVAARLAKYLHGPGAYLLRKAREAAAEPPASSPARGHQPASEKAPERTLAAAGEGRR